MGPGKSHQLPPPLEFTEHQRLPPPRNRPGKSHQLPPLEEFTELHRLPPPSKSNPPFQNPGYGPGMLPLVGAASEAAASIGCSQIIIYGGQLPQHLIVCPVSRFQGIDRRTSSVYIYTPAWVARRSVRHAGPDAKKRFTTIFLT